MQKLMNNEAAKTMIVLFVCMTVAAALGVFARRACHSEGYAAARIPAPAATQTIG